MSRREGKGQMLHACVSCRGRAVPLYLLRNGCAASLVPRRGKVSSRSEVNCTETSCILVTGGNRKDSHAMKLVISKGSRAGQSRVRKENITTPIYSSRARRRPNRVEF